MRVIQNPFRGSNQPLHPEAPYPSRSTTRVSKLLGQCPLAAPTPLLHSKTLAQAAGVEQFWIKDERARMGLGSFKALGAAYVIACHAAERTPNPDAYTLAGTTYVTASAGNHGLSLAAGAKVFGASAVVYIAETVPQEFAQRLQAKGAQVHRQGTDYAASMAAAEQAAKDNAWTLLSDSSWDSYTELPHLLMEGYLQMAAEACQQCPSPPSHILLQAGVGGLAGAIAALSRSVWADAPVIIVVEPEAAPALQASIEAGHAVQTQGPNSIMGRLDCKTPSLIALNGLARDADCFITLSDEQVNAELPTLKAAGLESTASGAAGIAAILNPQARQSLGIGAQAHVLAFLSEQAQ